jgi:TolA-binding protein
VRALCTVCGIALSATLLVAQGAEDLSEDERLSFADGLYTREMHALAAKEYEAFIANFPNAASIDVAYFRLGECHRFLGNLPKADKAYKRVFADYPKSEFRHRAGFRRANIFMDADKPGAAIPLYQKLLKTEPPPDIAAPAHYYLGDTYLQEGKIEEAEKEFKIVSDRYRSSVFFAYAALKRASLRATDEGGAEADAAIKLYQDVLARAETDRVKAEAIYQLAELYYARGDFLKSAEFFARLLSEHASDQRTKGATLRAAWAAHNAGLYADALKTTEASMKGTKDKALTEWLYLKANCERQLSRSEAAVASYERLLSKKPSAKLADAATYERALTFYRMGRYAEAVKGARKVKTSDANRKDVYWLLAEASAAAKDVDQAIQYYRLITSKFADSDVAADAFYRLGYHLQQREQFKEAGRYYGQLAEKHPKSALAPQALYAAGYCLSEIEQNEDAIRAWAKLVEDYPGDKNVEEALYRKALAEIRAERPQDAVSTLARLQKDHANSSYRADAYYWRGMLLREEGQLQDAEKEFRLCLDAKPRGELERDAAFYLAVVLYRQKHFDEAATRFQPLVDSPLIDRFTSDLLEWLSSYHFEKGRHADAELVAEKLVEGARSPLWRQVGWSLVGRSRLAQDKQVEAAEAFAAALKEDANSPLAAEAALKLGQLRLGQKSYAEAQQLFKRAAGMASGAEQLGIRANAYMGLGRSTQALGEADEAARYFMSVAILYDDAVMVPEGLYQAATIFGELDKEDERNKTIDELHARYPDSKWAKQALQERDAPAQAKE